MVRGPVVDASGLSRTVGSAAIRIVVVAAARGHGTGVPVGPHKGPAPPCTTRGRHAARGAMHHPWRHAARGVRITRGVAGAAPIARRHPWRRAGVPGRAGATRRTPPSPDCRSRAVVPCLPNSHARTGARAGRRTAGPATLRPMNRGHAMGPPAADAPPVEGRSDAPRGQAAAGPRHRNQGDRPQPARATGAWTPQPARVTGAREAAPPASPAPRNAVPP